MKEQDGFPVWYGAKSRDEFLEAYEKEQDGLFPLWYDSTESLDEFLEALEKDITRYRDAAKDPHFSGHEQRMAKNCFKHLSRDLRKLRKAIADGNLAVAVQQTACLIWDDYYLSQTVVWERLVAEHKKLGRSDSGSHAAKTKRKLTHADARRLVDEKRANNPRMSISEAFRQIAKKEDVRVSAIKYAYYQQD